jgi:heme A synthase
MLGGFVIAQVTLGVLTILWRKPADVATLHQATAALLLAWAVWTTLIALRGVARVRAEARLDKPTPAEPVLAGQNG